MNVTFNKKRRPQSQTVKRAQTNTLGTTENQRDLWRRVYCNSYVSRKSTYTKQYVLWLTTPPFHTPPFFVRNQDINPESENHAILEVVTKSTLYPSFLPRPQSNGTQSSRDHFGVSQSETILSEEIPSITIPFILRNQSAIIITKKGRKKFV